MRTTPVCDPLLRCDHSADRIQRYYYGVAAYCPQIGRATARNNLSAGRGFTLIEMMISLTIGLVIVGALVSVLISNSQNAKTNDRTAELQSNGRYAMDHLKRELRHAGFRGYTREEPTPPTTAITITNECLDGGADDSFVVNIRQGVWGADDSDPYGANCLPAGNRVRGDVLVIRRVASQPTATPVANTLYLRSTYAAGQVFQGGAPATPPAMAGTPINNFALQVYVYYIGRDDNDTAVSALRRITLKANGRMEDEMVVSGIEHMQVQYGIVDTIPNTRYFNANNIAGNPTSTNLAQTTWDGVNSVRIWLLARNSKKETGYTNTTNYPMGNITTFPLANDNYRRQLFTSVVQLRN